MADFYNNGGILVPVGTLMMYAGSNPPPGWLECDGSTLNRTTYARLFAAIGVIYGAGNGSTTFAIPDLKTEGRFLRSRSAAQAIGVAQGDATRALTAVYRLFGDSTSSPTVQSLSGCGVITTRAQQGVAATGTIPTSSNMSTSTAYSFGFDSSLTLPTATEIRPKNVAVMVIIRY